MKMTYRGFTCPAQIVSTTELFLLLMFKPFICELSSLLKKMPSLYFCQSSIKDTRTYEDIESVMRLIFPTIWVGRFLIVKQRIRHHPVNCFNIQRLFLYLNLLTFFSLEPY